MNHNEVLSKLNTVKKQILIVENEVIRLKNLAFDLECWVIDEKEFDQWVGRNDGQFCDTRRVN